MSRLEMSLFGGFHASVDGSPVSGFDTDKTRALLVYIVMEASRAHSREGLAGLLWPEVAEEAARRNLRNSLFKLRQALGEDGTSPGSLIVTPQTVQLDPASDYRLDAAEFSGLIAACRAHRHRKIEHCTTCHARLRRAAELYRGDFLRGFHLADCQEFEEWLVLKREALHRGAIDALGLLSTYHEARGEHEQALRYAYRQLELEPWREEAHRQAMRLLALTGQRSAALAQYETCRQVLAAELAAEPGAETTALYDHLNAGEVAEDAIAHSGDGSPWRRKLRALPVTRHNLPSQLAPFIGRRNELERIMERLDSPDYCLITLMGPGGVGKTRLALQAAAEQVGAFDDGVYWVPLASINSPQLLTSSIAQAIGFHFEASEDPQAQLLSYLRDKEMLLLLDNFEHLLGGHGDPPLQASAEATDLLLSMLTSAPRISLLVTSRERLGLQAEFLLDLSGLPFPEYDDRLESYDAVQLFMQRAQQAHSEFALSHDTAQGVIDICRLVAGLPLGIVLAAAWVGHFSSARIAASIKANLDFLSGAAKDASPQHSSLRAVFNHSWNLLSEEEQQVFRGLSVFRGGWEEEAAEQVTGASLLSLFSLVDKSLLRRDATGRFEIHEVLRQYATEKLDDLPREQDEIRHRHARHYLELAEFAEPGLKGEGQGTWLARLEREHDNLRAVLRWAQENGALEIGLRLGAALWRFWYVRGYYSEGREQLAAVLSLTGPKSVGASRSPTARAKVLNGAGVLASLQGDRKAARALYEESLALSRELRDKEGMASSLNNLGILAHQQGDSDAGRALQEESLALRRELGDKQGIASSLNNLGLVAQERGDYDAARSLHEETLALRRELGDTLGIASSLGNLGLVAQEQGDYDAARALYQESLTLRRELGDKAGMAELFSNLGLVAQKLGDYDAARDLYEQGLTLSRELGYTWSIALLLNNLGLVAQERGDYDSAGDLHKESLALRTELGETIGIAGSLACLGGVVTGRVRRGLEQGTKEPQEHLGQLERAARIFGAVDRLLESTPAVLTIEERVLYEQNLAAIRSMLDEATFAEAWAGGRAMTPEQTITYTLSSG